MYQERYFHSKTIQKMKQGDYFQTSFYFLKGLVTTSHFVHDFSRKMFPMLYSINWPSFIFWLPLLLNILDNICFKIDCWSGCDVMKFPVQFIFLIKSHLQSFSWYFETFWYFAKFSFHHKRKNARLLLTNTEYTSCLTSCRAAKDLGSWETRKS